MTDYPTPVRDTLTSAAGAFGGPDPDRCFVLGMHRSGTSLVAGMLSEAGFWPGPDEELLPPDAGNERGYVENRRVIETNERLLTSLGRTWRLPPSADQLRDVAHLWQRTMSNEVERLVRQRPPGQSGVLVKDPRLAVLWEAWTTEFRRGRLLVVARHPVESARSLADREGMSLPRALALWEAYYCRILEAVAEFGAGVIDYDGLMRGADSAMVKLPLRSKPQSFSSHGPEPLLRHHWAREEDASLLSVEQARLWQTLRELAETSGPVGPGEVGAVRSLSISARLTLVDWERADQRLATSGAEVDEAVARIDELRAELAEVAQVTVRLEDVERDRDELKDALATSAAEATRQQAELLQLRTQVAVLVRGLREHEERAAHRDEELRSLASDLARVRQDGDALRSRAEEAEALIESLRGQLDAAVAEGQELRARHGVELTELAQARDEAGHAAAQLRSSLAELHAHFATTQSMARRREQVLVLQLEAREGELAEVRSALTDAQAVLDTIFASRSWRVSNGLRRMFGRAAESDDRPPG